MSARRARSAVLGVALAGALIAAAGPAAAAPCPTPSMGERLLDTPRAAQTAFPPRPHDVVRRRATGRLGFSAEWWNVPSGTPRCGEWAADGIRHVRIDLMWKDVERVPGVYDWSTTDTILATLNRAGLTILPVLDTSAPAYQSIPGEQFSPPTNVAAYAAWAAAAVARYGPGGRFWAGRSDPKPIRAVEIWNEPYAASFWRTGPDVGAYRSLFVAAARAVRAVDPRIKLGLAVNPTFRPVGAARDAAWARPLLRDRTVRSLTDFLSVHPYERPDPGNPATDADRVYGFAMVAGIRAAARAAGWRDPRIWITEIGFPATLGELRQTRHNRAAIVRAFGEWGRFVDRYYLYSPGNTGRRPEEIFRPGTAIDRGSYAAATGLVAARSGYLAP